MEAGRSVHTHSEIQRKISFLLEQAPVEQLPDASAISSIIIPASDFSRSGGVAAKAVRQILSFSYNTVILLHQSNLVKPYCYVASEKTLPEFCSNLSYDDRLRRELLSFPGVEVLETDGAGSEALRTAMLYLKWLDRPVTVLPMVCGELEESDAQALAKHIGLATGTRSKVLLMAATDIISNRSAEDAAGLSDWLQPSIEDMEAGLLYGIAPESAASIDVAVRFAREKGAAMANVLVYRTTADLVVDADQVDGYLSAILY